MVKSKDAKNLKEYDITAYTKGLLATSTINNITTHDYFQYKQIYNILHHKNVGIEIIGYSGIRRVFYHNTDGESQILFDLISAKMNDWLGTNLN